MRNLDSGNRMLVAVYDGADEKPEYRLMHMTGCPRGSLVIKGRKKWMPLRDGTDVVSFGRTAVWRMALMAESALANRDEDKFAKLIGAAVGLRSSVSARRR